MAKKKKKAQQPFSEKRYIIEKARSLPIYECVISKNWKEQGIGNVVVARQHASGNMTVGVYLVDIFCLGVKNTSYFFNLSSVDYEKFVEHMGTVDHISYELAHNIVFAAIEFAEEYGFSPHPEFKLTQYILEEDTEDIELIDIECGKDGQPFYIAGPNDTNLIINHVLNQLEKTAGEGNFKFLLPAD